MVLQLSLLSLALLPDSSVCYLTITILLKISSFTVVFTLTWVANKWRMQKISLRDQTIMAFGGLRGAICFGLVLTIGKILSFSFSYFTKFCRRRSSPGQADHDIHHIDSNSIHCIYSRNNDKATGIVFKCENWQCLWQVFIPKLYWTCRFF